MRSFRIGSAFGIPLKVDLTFLVVLPLFAYAIGVQIEAVADFLNAFGTTIEVAPLTAGPVRWAVGLTAALGLFVGVVLHELGHSLVARRYGLDIDSITLWIFGGIARLGDLPEEWHKEFWIAVAGPAVSVALGVLSLGVYRVLPAGQDAALFVFGYLGLLNLGLAGFNLLPAFPMDGGRVLRAVLARNRPYVRATHLAAEVGKAFAFLFGILGLFRLNVILIGVAFFIYIAASSEAQQVALRAAFQGVTVRDLMTPGSELQTVEPATTIADLAERMFQERHTGYPVVERGEPVGMVTLEDAKDVPPVERDAYRVEDVMSRDLVTVGPDDEAMTAMTTMQQHGVGRLLVLDGEELVGLVSRTDLMRAFDVVKSTGSAALAEDATEPARLVEGR